MSDRIDGLLARLKAAPPDHDLSRLEAGVWSRIQGEGREGLYGRRTLAVQLAAACGALLVGLLIARVAGYESMPHVLSSEVVVLSDDSVLAPSIRLEGGI
jgi:hypothetical protein